MGKRRAYDVPGAVHKLTFSVHRRVPVFADPKCADAFVECLARAKELRRFQLYGFVVMPDHVPRLAARAGIDGC